MAHHILLVENDEELIQRHTFLLEENGYRVTPFTRGGGIIDAINRYPTDLIVMDVSLPDGDGLTRLMEIRKQSDIPIIVFSTREGEDDRLMALGMGADDYMTKPCNPRELVLRINNVLARSAHGVAPTETRTQKDKRTTARPDTHDRRHRKQERPPGMAINTFTKDIPVGLLVMFMAILVFGGGGYWYANKPLPPGPGPDVTATTTTTESPAPDTAPAEPKPQAPTPDVAPATASVARAPSTAAAPTGGEKSITWIYDARCGRIPDVSWWDYNSYESIAKYVNKRYAGNWDEYVAVWVNRHKTMESIHLRNSTAIAPSGVRLNGQNLKTYVEQLGTRVKVIQCLAKAAASQ